MSDVIRRMQEVKSLATDRSVPAPQRLAEVALSFAALDLTGFADKSREPWEADLAHLQDALAQFRLAMEERPHTDEEESQRMLDLVEDVASQAIEGELDRIVEELDAGVDKLPEDAIREVRQHADLMVPRLIEVLREATADARADMAPEGNAHFFALFLLTELRAEQAFPAILEAFSLPGELPEELFGDAVSEMLPRMLALFDGQRLEVTEALIDNRDLNEYVRWAAGRTYVHRVRDGRLRRDEAVERLRRHLRTAIDEKDEAIAGEIVCVLTSFAPVEALDEIRQAFRDKLIEPFLVDMPSVEQSIADGEAGMRKRLEWCPPTGIEDTIDELREWSSFKEEPDRRIEDKGPVPWDPRWASADLEEGPVAEPVLSRGVRVGRNEPCPCGSGKKFKKCCLGKK